jgi:hypothetical protein
VKALVSLAIAGVVWWVQPREGIASSFAELREIWHISEKLDSLPIEGPLHWKIPYGGRNIAPYRGTREMHQL